jgi:hypothetical protein
MSRGHASPQASANTREDVEPAGSISEMQLSRAAQVTSLLTGVPVRLLNWGQNVMSGGFYKDWLELGGNDRFSGQPRENDRGGGSMINRFCICMTSDDIPAADRERLRSVKAAILKSAQWQLGQVITIRFLDGAPELQERVRDVALEWTKITDLNFDFRKNSPTMIRIAFQPGDGSWSYLGTVCQTIPEPQPTMNYGWLTPKSSDDDVRSVVLHEFGHAIGLIHEHQAQKRESSGTATP